MSDERGSVLWLTGLSGAGKSTSSAALADRLSEMGARIELIDGDALRAMLPTGFTPTGRDLCVRRVGFLAQPTGAARCDGHLRAHLTVCGVAGLGSRPVSAVRGDLRVDAVS